MDNELEVIRTQMEHTRSDLADKLETLEAEFRGTVQGATSAVANTVETVQNTVENVKESVKETVETVKESLDIRKHVERHPWAMFGGAFLVGCLAGSLLGRPRKSRPRTPTETPPAPEPLARNGHGRHNGASRKAAETEEEGPLTSGLKALKGLAIGTLMGSLRDVLVKAVPENLVADLTNVVDDMTTKLGGKLLPQSEETAAAQTATEGETQHVEPESAEVGRSVGPARWSRQKSGRRPDRK